jgi:superoxide dismutase, Cu-Zn family
MVYAGFPPGYDVINSVAVLRGDSAVTGTVEFEQTSESAPTKISYSLTGLDPSENRGFHVQ